MRSSQRTKRPVAAVAVSLALAALVFWLLDAWPRDAGRSGVPGAGASAPSDGAQGRSEVSAAAPSAPQRVPASAPDTAAPTRATGAPADLNPWGEPGPVLEATLVDPDGEPLASRYVAFRLLLARGEESFDLGTTDARGRYVWRVADRTALVEPAREVSFTVDTGRASALAATVRLQRTLAPGRDDLGVVRLLQRPLAVGGTVVDEAGVPHAGAEIRVLFPVTGDPAGADRADDGMPYVAPWPPLRVFADERGAFALREELRFQRVALVPLARDGLAVRPVGVRTGTADLRLIVPRASSLVGSLRLDDPAAATAFSVRVHRLGNGGTHELGMAEPRADGSFRVGKLTAGPVSVLVVRGSETVARVDGVILEPARECADPRLAGIDVRRGETALAVAVRGAADAPAGYATVFAVENGHVLAQAHADQKGTARLSVPRVPVDLWVVPPATFFDDPLRPVLVRRVAADTVVRLAKGPRVVLAWDASGAGIPRHLQVQPVLFERELARPDGAPDLSGGPGMGGMMTGLHPRRLGEPFAVPSPGTYRVLFEVRDLSGQTVTAPAQPEVVTVRDVAEVQSFAVEPAAGALARAFGQLEKR